MVWKIRSRKANLASCFHPVHTLLSTGAKAAYSPLSGEVLDIQASGFFMLVDKNKMVCDDRKGNSQSDKVKGNLEYPSISEKNG